MPRLITPMMASLRRGLPHDDDRYGWEFKWDGVRVVAYVTGGQVRLLSRTGRDMTGSFPELAVLGQRAGAPVIVDGEIIAVGQGRPDFGLLQSRMHVRDPPASLAHALEGVIGKPLASAYHPGQRRDWIKIKNTRQQEVIICGWKPGQGRRADTIGSLLVGVWDGPRLRYAGHVGTGFTQAALADLTHRLQPLRRADSPFGTAVPAPHARGAQWVQPRLVGEVAFTEWTRDGRLRHPRFLGLRDDKPAHEVVRE